MRNPRKFCKWNPFTFWNMFRYLSLESRNTQTQNCAPIQCTVWPRNGCQKRVNGYLETSVDAGRNHERRRSSKRVIGQFSV